MADKGGSQGVQNHQGCELFQGRPAIIDFLTQKWTKVLSAASVNPSGRNLCTASNVRPLITSASIPPTSLRYRYTAHERFRIDRQFWIHVDSNNHSDNTYIMSFQEDGSQPDGEDAARKLK
jgi:hypothetical protein